MELKVTNEEKYSIITPVIEKLDSTVSSMLKAEAVLLNGKGIKNLIINLGQVKYIDSSGLSSILVANRLCNASGGVLVLCHIQENPQKLISISQLDSILNIVPSEEEAVEYVYMDDIEKSLEE